MKYRLSIGILGVSGAGDGEQVVRVNIWKDKPV